MGKAYDLLWVKLLIYMLHNMGSRGNMLKWIYSILTDRQFYVRVGSKKSSLRFTTNGCPQESLINTLLFIILTNFLEKVLFSCNVK